MNIFILSDNKQKNAEYHVDSHVRKMILEYLQMLCTTKRIFDGKQYSFIHPKTKKKRKIYLMNNEQLLYNEETQEISIQNKILYLATHENHLCNVWVRNSLQNYNYLIELAGELFKEFKFRFKKEHNSYFVLEYLKDNPIINTNKFPYSDLTKFALAMPEFIKDKDSTVASYRDFYIYDKYSFAKWTNRNVPKWFEDGFKKAKEQNKLNLNRGK